MQLWNSLHRHCVQFTDEGPSQGTAAIGNDCLILMNILSYKLNYLVFAAGRAELKLLLFNSMFPIYFSFVDCCSPLLLVNYEIYIIFLVANIYFILGEKTGPFSGLDFCQFFPQKDLL